MRGEAAAVKGRRYLGEGRLIVTEVNDKRIRAQCRGDGTIWHPEWDPSGWRCDCPARTPDCSHLVALRLVTTRRARR